MKVRAVLAVDCGISNGGIALYAEPSKVTAIKMPREVRDLGEYFKYVKDTYGEVLCFVENVSSYQSDTDTAGKRFGIDKLLANFESVKTALTLTGIPFIKVYPQSWQHGLNLKKKGEEKSARKLRYKAAAAKYYPEIKTAAWNADALCILQFGRIKLNTDPDWIIEKLPPAAIKSIF